MRTLKELVQCYEYACVDLKKSSKCPLVVIKNAKTEMTKKLKIRDTEHLLKEIERAIAIHGANVDLNHFDTSSVHDMRFLFEGSNFNGSVDKWDVSNVGSMYAMFRHATSFNQPLNSWDVSSVTDMTNMFFNAKAFNQPLNMWDTSRVIAMSYMFCGANKFNQSLENWDVSNVEDMHAMFSGEVGFNNTLLNWSVRNGADTSCFLNGKSFFENKRIWESNILKEKFVIKNEGAGVQRVGSYL